MSRVLACTRQPLEVTEGGETDCDYAKTVISYAYVIMDMIIEDQSRNGDMN